MLIFAGDTHGKHGHLGGVPEGEPVIHVGDLAPLGGMLSQALPSRLLDRFFFIPGNHDYDEDLFVTQLLEDPLAATANIDGRVVTIGGFRVAGLGGVFRDKVWAPRVGNEPPALTYAEAVRTRRIRDSVVPRRLRMAIWKEVVDRLAAQRADILVTHEAPTTHRYGFGGIDELAKAMGVHTIVHGHHHQSYRATLPGTSIQVIGLGECELCDERGGTVPP